MDADRCGACQARMGAASWCPVCFTEAPRPASPVPSGQSDAGGPALPSGPGPAGSGPPVPDTSGAELSDAQIVAMLGLGTAGKAGSAPRRLSQSLGGEKDRLRQALAEATTELAAAKEEVARAQAAAVEAAAGVPKPVTHVQEALFALDADEDSVAGWLPSKASERALDGGSSREGAPEAHDDGVEAGPQAVASAELVTGAARTSTKVGWPCLDCKLINDFSADSCQNCWAPFGAALSEPVRELPGTRMQRRWAAVAGSLALICLLSLVGYLIAPAGPAKVSDQVPTLEQDDLLLDPGGDLLLPADEHG